ncbi:MAG: hypothetical protein ACE361_12370 [Aureliella sp.]
MSKTIARKRPGVWLAQIWKEAALVWRSGALLVILGFCLLQALIAFGYWVAGSQDLQQSLVRDMVLPALLTPTLVAIACSGMQIGHERESRSWEWGASLPQSWFQSLFIKFAFGSLAVLFSALCMCITPALANLILGARSAFDPWLSFMGLATISAWSSLTVLSICVLWFRESLMALVAGVFFAVGLQGFTAYIFSLFPNLVGFLLAMIFWLSVWISLAAIYEWRWGTGQQFSMGGLIGSTKRRKSALSRPKTRARARNEIIAIFNLALRQNLGAYSALLLGVCLVAPWVQLGYLVSVLVLVVCIVGGFAFSGDQVAGRYRFLADQGATPWKVTLMKFLVSAFFSALIVGCAFAVWDAWYASVSSPNPKVYQAAALSMNPEEMAIFVLVTTGALLLSAMSSVVFQRGLSALAASVFLVMATTAAVGLLVNLLRQAEIEVDWLLKLAVISFAAFSLPLWLFSLFRFTGRWMKFSEPNNVPRFAFAVSAGLVVPVTVGLVWGLPSLDLLLH